MKKIEINREFYLDDIYQIIYSSCANEEKREQILEFYYFELSEAITHFSKKTRDKLYEFLSLEDITRIFEYIDPTEVEKFIDEFDFESRKAILNEMSFDDLVDIILAIDEEEAYKYLTLLDVKKRTKIKIINKYSDNQIASIMNTEFASVNEDMTIKEAINKLVKDARTTEYIDNIYVVHEDKLIGTVSLRELIVAGANPLELVKNIMTENIVSLNLDLEIDEAINIFSDYDFLMMPVVDDEDNLIGVVTFDDITDAIDEQTDEDLAALAGVSDINIDISSETIGNSVKKRLPWLLFLLVINIFTAAIISNFEETLNAIPILSIFLPLILNMSGNSGTQSLAVIIRIFTKRDDEEKQLIKRHIVKEFFVGVCNGFLIGVSLFVLVILLRLMKGEQFMEIIPFAFVIAISIFFALILATLAGTLIPLVIRMLKIDPAAASGPFITTINDIVSLFVYFSLATMLLARFL